MAMIVPAFFYAAIMLGRWLAPGLLRTINDVRLAQGGLLLACGGIVGLILSHALLGVAVSAALAGLGLASVYPITISLLSREFGAAAARVGSLMFTLSYLGGGVLPWIAGVASNRFNTLKVGLTVPLITGALMSVLLTRQWKSSTEQAA